MEANADTNVLFSLKSTLRWLKMANLILGTFIQNVLKNSIFCEKKIEL